MVRRSNKNRSFS